MGQQLKDFERREKEFLDSISIEEELAMLQYIERYLKLLDKVPAVDKPDDSAEPRTDSGSSDSNPPN